MLWKLLVYSIFPNKPFSPQRHPIQQPDIIHLLLQQNRKIVPILGDGNSFFRSLSSSTLSTTIAKYGMKLYSLLATLHTSSTPSSYLTTETTRSKTTYNAWKTQQFGLHNWKFRQQWIFMEYHCTCLLQFHPGVDTIGIITASERLLYLAWRMTTSSWLTVVGIILTAL